MARFFEHSEKEDWSSKLNKNVAQLQNVYQANPTPINKEALDIAEELKNTCDNILHPQAPRPS